MVLSAVLVSVLAAVEHRVQLSEGSLVALSTRGPSAFRVRLVGGDDDAPIASVMVEPDGEDANFTEVSSAVGVGIRATFGEVLVSAAGEVVLLDSAGAELARSSVVQAGVTELQLTSSQEQVLYGGGAGPDDATVLRTEGNVTPLVVNRATYVPHYYSTAGYSALGVVSADATFITRDGAMYPASFASSGSGVTWNFTVPFELYLMPAASLEEGTRAYYDLIGRPRVPPKWSFGFIASRWGWDNRTYIEDTLHHFRDGEFPADAFIVDFLWYANGSDYAFHAEGEMWFNDFDWHNTTFPAPREQMQKYRDMGFRYAGIRKPRLGNSELLADASSKGWILPQGEPGGDPFGSSGFYGVGRELDFSQAALRDWYADHQAHYLADGVSFWWNDEGETDYFTFHWWNVAQADTLRLTLPSDRFYALNRAFSPGMARLGVGFWTGDINPTWGDLAQQPGMMLKWGLAGSPYVGCDIGGFTGETNAALLARWYQQGVFLPIMRVHSVNVATPHWPWLWGAEAGEVMKAALELRYRLLPYHYSLAHRMYNTGQLWMRSMAQAFSTSAATSDLTSQWMDGDILVAPVLTEDSQMEVVLPEGQWYPFPGGGPAVHGPTKLSGLANASDIPAFVAAGSVVPLGPVVQHTGALPGGPLEVLVFPGADGSFELIDDDGETTAYEQGTTRCVQFTWTDASATLSWTASGTPGPHHFQQVFITGPSGARSGVVDIASSGELRLAAEFVV
mmetsp:Transcript_41321/g.108534  ORF Transcript_41321/g.108534 Transcript_41321/m.108534 type:complete len:735 (-) Transcript_41321:84-2288(-)